MLSIAMQNQTDSKELLAWLDTIPFSKTAKNLTRDFSDAVLMAELLKLYYPRHVELHNYVPASSLQAKRENWSMLNRKVLRKLDMKLNKDTIHHLANASQGTIEKLLWELRRKVLGSEEDKSKSKYNAENIDIKTSNEKIVDDLSDKDERLDPSAEEITKELDICDQIHELNPSRFTRFKRRIFIVFNWFIRFSLIWNIFTYCKLRHPGKRRDTSADALVPDVVINEQVTQVENVICNETVSCTIYAELKQELREKEEIIRSLNHKIAYLESSMKLKDLRISNLTEQIPQNAIEIDQKSRHNDIRPKLRLRSHNIHEIKTN